jgi:hypothetical protein
LERTYGLNPLRKIKNPLPGDNADKYFSNDQRLIFPRAKALPLKLSDIREHLDDLHAHNQHLPFLVINTTSTVGPAGNFLRSFLSDDKFSKRYVDTVFEFTPLGYGAEYYGYVTGDNPEVSFSKAVSISGAAVDGQADAAGAFGRFALNVLNLNLGYHINNYNLKSSARLLHKILPFPLYYLDGHYARDIDSTSIYLSDGGHTENLGLYSLIMRGVKNIIVVDAEQDSMGKFEAYEQLKSRLHDEYNLCLTLDKCDLFDVKNTPISILQGKVTGFPKGIFDDEVEKEFTIRIQYIKLSIDSLAVSDNCMKDPAWCSINYYQNKFPEKFPHQSTADIQYSKTQVAAYRDLGYMIGKKLHLADFKQETAGTCKEGNITP